MQYLLVTVSLLSPTAILLPHIQMYLHNFQNAYYQADCYGTSGVVTVHYVNITLLQFVTVLLFTQ